jgi:hypothetical protein
MRYMRYMPLAVLIFGLSSQAFAQETELPDLLTTRELATEFGISPSDGQDLSMLRSNRLQIVVHKALINDTLVVILDGKTLFTWPTSTGREQWETATNGQRDFTATPAGQFHIFRMVKDYESKEWGGPMFDAMFFNGGIAIHGTTSNHYGLLGTPASGGCVRLTKENADLLWEQVRAVGTRNTVVMVTSE